MVNPADLGGHASGDSGEVEVNDFDERVDRLGVPIDSGESVLLEEVDSKADELPEMPKEKPLSREQRYLLDQSNAKKTIALVLVASIITATILTTAIVFSGGSLLALIAIVAIPVIMGGASVYSSVFWPDIDLGETADDVQEQYAEELAKDPEKEFEFNTFVAENVKGTKEKERIKKKYLEYSKSYSKFEKYVLNADLQIKKKSKFHRMENGIDELKKEILAKHPNYIFSKVEDKESREMMEELLTGPYDEFEANINGSNLDDEIKGEILKRHRDFPGLEKVQELEEAHSPEGEVELDEF